MWREKAVERRDEVGTWRPASAVERWGTRILRGAQAFVMMHMSLHGVDMLKLCEYAVITVLQGMDGMIIATFRPRVSARLDI